MGTVLNVSGNKHGEKLSLLQEHWGWFRRVWLNHSLKLQPAPELCVVNCPQYAVAVLQSCLLWILPSSFCLHCFLLLLSSLPLACVPEGGSPFFSLSGPDLKVIISLPKLKGSVPAVPCPPLLWPPQTRWQQGQHAHDKITNISYGQHPYVSWEKEEKLMSINNLRCVRLTFWDNGEQSLQNIQKMRLAVHLPCASLDCSFQNRQAEQMSFMIPPFQ